MKTNKLNQRFSVITLMILLAAMSRLLPHPPNFAPIGGMALFGAAYFSKRYWAFIVPIAAVWISKQYDARAPLRPLCMVRQRLDIHLRHFCADHTVRYVYAEKSTLAKPDSFGIRGFCHILSCVELRCIVDVDYVSQDFCRTDGLLCSGYTLFPQYRAGRFDVHERIVRSIWMGRKEISAIGLLSDKRLNTEELSQKSTSRLCERSEAIRYVDFQWIASA